MTFALSTQVLRMPFRHPFRIARAEDVEASTSVVIELSRDGLVGRGEAYPVAYYGETPETVAVVLPRLRAVLDTLGPIPAKPPSALRWLERSSGLMDEVLGRHGGAKAGLDGALHDIAGKALGIPVWRLLGASPQSPPTDHSLGLDAPARVAERAREVAHFPALKVKVGGPTDLETLEAVRAVYRGPLRVDANTAWRPEKALALLPELERLGVELIEQPFPAHRLAETRWLTERSRLPILADESAVFEEDLEMLAGVVHGVVVKLVKCGGIGPALRMMRRAKALGMKVMIGCMVESSLGIAAAASVASEADWVDLDGNLLLSDDPFKGLDLTADCRWQLSDRPGLGISPSGPGEAASTA